MKRLLCTLLVCMLLVTSGCSQTPSADVNPSVDENGEPICSGHGGHAYFNLLIENQQDLDALYATAPYQDYLPQTVLEGFTFVEGYGVVCDVPAHKDLSLWYANEDGILLRFGMDMSIVPPIADPKKPETYSIAWYLEWRKSPPPEAYNPLGQVMPPENYSVDGLFRAEDLSEDLYEAVFEGRTQTDTNEDGTPSHTSTSFSVICGEYRVHYGLSKTWDAGEEPEWIPYNEIYEMITSAKYFQK